jgi:osmotically-inducible protein OsmY
MTTSESMRAAAVGLFLAVVLTGCTAFSRCGVRECPADARLSAEVRTLLAESPELGTPNSISVQSLHGVVYLQGLVSTPFQIAQAGSLAARVPGVTGVENMLSIDNAR